jgi:hypothetical protein
MLLPSDFVRDPGADADSVRCLPAVAGMQFLRAMTLELGE